jgi:flagella basal body P-ring formation protein FlgA
MARAALALLIATLVASAGASASGAKDVEAVLLDALRARYPEVMRWEVQPFDRANSAQATADADQVLSLGARSAVRVGRRVQWYTVAGFRNVVSAVHRAAAGDSLDPTAAQIEERDVLAARCEPLVDVDALTGMRAKRPLRADEIICTNEIEPRPLVARGEPVVVKYVGPHVTLTTKGIAQADGAIGDTLRVRDARNSAEFAAQVSGAGEVTIHE